jgi:hypothetical protein
MRLFFFILTGFLALYACRISTNKDSSISSTTHIDTGKGVIIENSLGPKGAPYTDPTGKKFGYAMFWTRVINETATPLELTINFPADSFSIPPSPDSYLKLFVPPDDSMTLDKESLYDYGSKYLKSLLDTGLNKPTTLQRTINPKEEYFFYIGSLSYHSGGMVRAGLVLKDQELFYRFSIIPHFDSALFPCGHIVFKK